MANNASKVAALTWHNSISGTPFLLLNNTNYTWDPGVMKCKDTILEKCDVPHQVQFVKQATELSPFSSEAYNQYYAPNGVNSVLRGTSFILQRAAHSSQDNYFCCLHYKTEYWQMMCLWKFSTSPMRQWCHGFQMALYFWLYILRVWSEIVKPLSCTHIPELATWQNKMISASHVWDPGTMLLLYNSTWCLLSTEEREMVGLVPKQWSLCFNSMDYCQIFQKCNALSSQLYWHQDIKFTGIDLWMIHFQVP
jgi:hypothetical protein